MSTNKADNEKARKANSFAVKGFPKAKVKEALSAMSDARGNEEAQRETRAASALSLCTLAYRFRGSQDDSIPVDTIVGGWREHLNGVVLELAIKGNKFAELIEAKGDKPQTAKLTGYGNNVCSIAKGVIEFDIAPADTFRDTRTAVEEARQEARRESNPELAALSDAKAACDEAWKELRKSVFDKNHTGLIDTLAEMLREAREELMASEAAQGEAETEDDADGNTDAEPEVEAEAA